jgi:hypothetical protein
MPRLTSLSFVALLAIATTHAADPRETEIRNAMESFGRCWDAHAKDPGCMDRLLAPDFTAVALGAREFDRAGFIDFVKNLPASNTWGSGPGDRMPGAVVRFYGPVALITYSHKNATPVEHLARFTHVFVNSEGRGWLMARLHASRPNIPTQAKK